MSPNTTDKTVAKKDYRQFIFRKTLYLVVMLLVMFVCMGVSLTIGPRDLSFSEVYKILWDHICGATYELASTEWWNDYIVIEERMPRVVIAVVAGIGLALCGVVMQGIVKNPLADPYTTGISSGAVFGVSVSMVLGLQVGAANTGYGTLLNAFVFGMVPAFIIMLLSRMRNSTPATIILAGIAMSFLFSALSTLLVIISDAETVHNIYKWQIGSLSGVTWDTFPLMAAVVVLGSIISLVLSNRLNVLALGDDSARSLGLDAKKLRIVCLIIISLVAASVCCYLGIIGFVGLVAPNITRMIMGSDNKFLIPASMMCGATILLFADTVSRYITFADVPVGVIMSFIGGPLFLILIILNKKGVW